MTDKTFRLFANIDTNDYGDKFLAELTDRKADIRQEQTADYLATFTEFYGADGAVMCMSREGERLYFQEFLGDPHILPGVLTALGAKTGHLRMPGGNPYAMHLGFEKTLPEDAYLGIPLG